jgi:hypothetical protein
MVQTRDLEREFRGSRIRDARRRRNLAQAAELLAARADASYSAALGHAVRQSVWRTFRDPEVSVADILAGHVAETAARAGAEAWVLGIHDTTPLSYNTHAAKVELGPHNGGENERCLLLHSVLLVNPAGVPLGLLGLKLWTRDREKLGQSEQRKHRPAEEKESHKWREGLACAEAALPPETRLVLVSDAEGDVLAYLTAPRREGTDLLLRAAQDRVVWCAGERGYLFGVAAGAPVCGERRVTVPARQGEPEREAVLTVRECWVELSEPGGQRPNGVRYRVVRAAEEVRPEGVKEPLDWVLLTTLDETQVPEAEELVGMYTRRWRIEQWHSVLKSGQQVERLQIDGLEPLKKVIALLAVVAWQVMYVTHMGRTEPEAPAEEVLGAEELAVLREAAPKRVRTAWEVVREVARLGGYEPYRNGPPPGVKTVWRGLRKLHDLLAGWRLARRAGQREEI